MMILRRNHIVCVAITYDCNLETIQVVVSGMSCKQRCVENFRPCKCLEKLNCAISGNAVIIDFGGTQYR